MDRINRDLHLLNARISRSLNISTNDASLPHIFATSRTGLTPKERMERLIYAKTNQNRNWDNVIFSDEKSFESGPISTRIWGWIGLDGPGEMAFITRHMDSVQYCDILEQVLIPSVEISYGNMQNVVFMQDNNSTHTSRYTNAWFANHPQIATLVAPPNSPDLNPIENFWAETTRDWQSVFPRNRATLEPIIVENWEKFRGQTGYFQNLYNSMPYRMQEVIRNNGGPTSY